MHVRRGLWLRERIKKSRKNRQVPGVLKGFCCDCESKVGFISFPRLCVICDHKFCGLCTFLGGGGKEEGKGGGGGGGDESYTEESDTESDIDDEGDMTDESEMEDECNKAKARRRMMEWRDRMHGKEKLSSTASFRMIVNGN